MSETAEPSACEHEKWVYTGDGRGWCAKCDIPRERFYELFHQTHAAELARLRERVVELEAQLLGERMDSEPQPESVAAEAKLAKFMVDFRASMKTAALAPEGKEGAE